MKPKITMILFLVFGLILVVGGAGIPGQDDGKTPDTERVQIGPNAVIMPLGKMVLVRKDSKYCGVRFIEAWTGETKLDMFAKYESYYQGDGTGDFLRNNVQFMKGQLAVRRLVGLGRFLSWHAGPENKEIKCGPIKLAWYGRGSVYFNDRVGKSGDRGVELAPTKWTDISQVDVFDSHLKWYRYDDKRKDIYIPIDQLREDTENKK